MSALVVLFVALGIMAGFAAVKDRREREREAHEERMRRRAAGLRQARE